MAVSYIKRLQTDIELEMALWQKSTDYFSTAQAYGRAALEGFSAPVEDLDEQFLIAIYQASQIWYMSVLGSQIGVIGNTMDIASATLEKLRTE
ncbi:MAG: hypothetical protein HQ492_12645 [Woeseiaceae bacterium]|nr:hypothetical protein [Woeseiaceae bacterium]